MTGTAAAGLVSGTDGNDVIVGNGGADVLFGNSGADRFSFTVLDGSIATIADFDYLEGDTLGFSGSVFSAPGLFGQSAVPAERFLSGDSVDANSADGHHFLYNTTTGALFYDADGVAGGAVQVATLTGAPELTAADIFVEGDNPNAGSIITGDAGDNTLTGSDRADILRGFAGNDRLDGGLGADIMEGGIGNDVYVVDNAGDVVTEGPGAPPPVDFVPPAGFTVLGRADLTVTARSTCWSPTARSTRFGGWTARPSPQRSACRCGAAGRRRASSAAAAA